MGVMGSLRTGLMLMLLVTLPDTSGACPRPCACYVPAEVHCTFRSLTAVPPGISTRVQRINLGFNNINHIADVSFSGLRRLELLMMHGNNVRNIPDAAFKDLVSLQVLKMSYNKVRVITGHTFSGLMALIRLHLDHNRVEFIHPDAFSGMTSLRLLHLEGNHLQKLHPATFSTFSLLQRFHMSTLKHLYLSENLLSVLPREMLENMPQLENLYLYGNPWSCDCRMSWLQGWRAQHTGVMKCKKDRILADGQLCPVCSSPKHLTGTDISEVKEFICSGPAINSSGKDISQEENISELLPIERIKAPFGNVSLSLSDEHGTKVDLICQILQPRDSTKISWNYTKTLQIAANMTLFFDLECSIDRDIYESFWRLLAYYSEVPVHLKREIMLTKEPELSYRYKQDIEKDAFYYTGVRANVLARPAWLMQSFMNIKLNRPYSSSKSVRLILHTHVSTTTDTEPIRLQRRSWVMIKHDNKTQTTFSCVVGGMIEMTCDVLGSEDLDIQWMLPDGLRIKAPSSAHHNRVTVSSTGKLHIKSVDHSDSGVYYCIAEVAGDVDVLPFRLSVVDSSTPLQGEEVGSALTRFVGESASLPCLTMAAPDAVVDWIFPDGSILNSKENTSRALIYPNGTLFIPHCQLNNNGYHKCVAMNQYGVDVLATKLMVMRRKGIQPLRPYPSRPQSASGVSTRVKAFMEDVEEASGDDSNTEERILPNRNFINRRRGQNARTQGRLSGHARRRRPFRKNMHGEQNITVFTNQRSVNTKNKVDPQKWADILSRIREKTAPKSTSLPIVLVSTQVNSVQTVNLEHPGLTDNTEGSSPDDSGPQKQYNIFGTSHIINQHSSSMQTDKLTAHIQEENKNINQIASPEFNTSSDKVTYITNSESVSNYVITEINVAKERHVGTISAEKNEQIYLGSVSKPESERENELNFSKSGVQAQTGGFNYGKLGNTSITSTSSIGQETPPDSVQLRAKNHLSSRRRFGGRRRIKLRRPFSNFTTRRPPSAFTAAGPFSTVALNRDHTTQARAYPTSEATIHIHLTTTTGDASVYPTSGATAQIHTTIPAEGTSVYPASGATTNIHPTTTTRRTSVHPTSGATTHIYSTTTARGTSVYPTSGATTHIYSTTTAKGTSVYPASEATTHIYSTTTDRGISVYTTSEATAHMYPTIQTGDPSVFKTSVATTYMYPTEQRTVANRINGNNEFITLLDEKKDGTITFAEEKMDEYVIPIVADPTSTPDAGHVSLTTALQMANYETESSFTLNPHLPESHFKVVVRENETLKTTNSREHVTSDEQSVITSGPQLFVPSLIKTTDKFKDSIKNQVYFPLTTETPKKSIILGSQTESFVTSSQTPVAIDTENNEIFVLRSVSKTDQRKQSVPAPDKTLSVSTTSTDTSPTITLPTTTPMISITTQLFRTTPSTEVPATVTFSTTSMRPALKLTPGLPLQDNKIPFYSRNPGTNYIEAIKNERLPNTSNRYPYYGSRNPFGPSIIRTPLNSVKNIQTTPTTLKTAVGSANLSPTTTSSTTQSNQQIQIRGESMNRQWSEVPLSQRPQTLPVWQMRPRITTAKLHTVSVNAGTRVQLACDAVGQPKPLMTWTKVSTGAVMSANARIQRFEVQSNGTFVIHSVQLQDRGQYLCSARNLYGTDKMIVTLVVLAHVPRMTLPRHQDLKVYLGRSAVMECQAQGLPTPNISWVLPDRSVVHTISRSEQRVMLYANGTLQIKNTNYLDRGIYKCIASNAAGVDMLSVRLQITALPPMFHQERRENITVLDGHAVYFHCTAEGSPSPAIRWVTFSGTHIRPSQFINSNLFVFPNGTLFIRKPTEKDSGNYDCVAVNSVGMATRRVYLQVKGNSSMAKIISSTTQNTDVHYGGQLSLDCNATGSPNPRIIWRTPSKKLVDVHYSSDGRIKVFSNGSLTITSVTEKDEGDYLCVARNRMGDDYLLLTVKVKMKAAKIEPKVLGNHRVLYGDELKVDCIASGLPDPEIMWSLPDGTMINSILQSDDSRVRNKRYVVFDNGTLYFNEVGMKEEGDYTCYAENHIGKDEMKVHIKVVADVPVIKNNTYSVIKVPYGKIAVLTCSAKGEPTPMITWTSPANRLISPVSDKHQISNDGTLYIQKVQRFDTGNYTCSARNIVGMDRKVIFVEVFVDAPLINGLKSPGTIRRTVVKDQHVLIDCKIEGNPLPQITWVLPNNVALPAPYYGSRVTVHRNGTLEIRKVQKSDTAVFFCIARNEGGEAKFQVQLDVTDSVEKPRLRNLPIEHIPLTDGALVTLNCSVEGRPTPEITWILPNGTTLLRGTSIFRFQHKLDGSLLIRQPSVSEVGRYRCVGHNSAGYVERTVMLEPSRKPRIINKYSSLLSIINGENLQLDCVASGNPPPKLTWTLPNGVILTRPEQTGRYAVLNNGTLTVQRASVYDRGIYVCQTTNQHGSSSLTVSVIVIAYPPRITSGPQPVTYARPGVALQLNCLALATPKAEVIWEMPEGIQFKVGAQPRLYGNKYLHPQGSLTIQNPSNKDNGLYRCTAKNVVGSDSRATYVYVF